MPTIDAVAVHPDDPLAAPLFADLEVEYDTRYGDLFGGAAAEFDRHPAQEFLPPSGELVLLVQDGEQVRVEVLDGSPVLPVQRHSSTTAATGRGVALVDRLSSAWGATPPSRLHGFAKGVWFTLPVAGVESSAWDGDWLEGL